jgi:hypothetical protein
VDQCFFGGGVGQPIDVASASSGMTNPSDQVFDPSLSSLAREERVLAKCPQGVPLCGVPQDRFQDPRVGMESRLRESSSGLLPVEEGRGSPIVANQRFSPGGQTPGSSIEDLTNRSGVSSQGSRLPK